MFLGYDRLLSGVTPQQRRAEVWHTALHQTRRSLETTYEHVLHAIPAEQRNMCKSENGRLGVPLNFRTPQRVGLTEGVGPNTIPNGNAII